MAQIDPFADPRLGRYMGGARPSPPDPRDYTLPHLARPRPSAFTTHDLRVYHGQSLAMSVRDQGAVGSCTGFAWTALRAAATARWHIDRGDAPDVRAPSPRFLYHLERSEMLQPPTYPQDSGADMRSGGLVLSRYGCALEEYCPYTGTANDPAPSTEAYVSGQFYGISTFYRLQGSGQALIDATLACLDDLWPFVIALNVYASFEQTGSNGRVPPPRRGERLLGGHALCVFGNFIDASFEGGGAWLVQNSWGPSWGQGGWCYLPFSYATADLGDGYGAPLSECWTVR